MIEFKRTVDDCYHCQMKHLVSLMQQKTCKKNIRLSCMLYSLYKTVTGHFLADS